MLQANIKSYHLAILGTLGLILNLLFFFYGSSDLYHAITQAHGQVGYNFYQHNSIWLNKQVTEYVCQQHDGQRLFEYDQLRDHNFGVGNDPFPVNDTIGYGVLLGLLWKLTGSLKFRDVQILQIIMYCLSLFFVYHIAFMLFGSTTVALYSGLAFLVYMPLIALNVQAVRDVWAYYALVILLWALLKYLSAQKSFWYLVLGCVWFALCQWLRPSVFLAVPALSGALLLLVMLKYYQKHKVFIAISCLILANIIIFWLPFMAYNQAAYGRNFVGPVGQDLLEGLGEFENPWGFELSDEFVSRYVGQKYSLVYGTPEFDDMARQEFNIAYNQNFALYWKNIFRRVPMLMLPALPWIFLSESPYKAAAGWRAKLGLLINSPALMWDFFVRHVAIRLWLILGYCGVILALVRKRYDVVILLLAMVCASWAKLPSHIEYRYLVPFYWVFSFFIGYVVRSWHAVDEAS